MSSPPSSSMFGLRPASRRRPRTTTTTSSADGSAGEKDPSTRGSRPASNSKAGRWRSPRNNASASAMLLSSRMAESFRAVMKEATSAVEEEEDDETILDVNDNRKGKKNIGSIVDENDGSSDSDSGRSAREEPNSFMKSFDNDGGGTLNETPRSSHPDHVENQSATTILPIGKKERAAAEVLNLPSGWRGEDLGRRKRSKLSKKSKKRRAEENVGRGGSNSDGDVLGKRLLELLNAHPEFRYRKRNEGEVCRHQEQKNAKSTKCLAPVPSILDLAYFWCLWIFFSQLVVGGMLAAAGTNAAIYPMVFGFLVSILGIDFSRGLWGYADRVLLQGQRFQGRDHIDTAMSEASIQNLEAAKFCQALLKLERPTHQHQHQFKKKHQQYQLQHMQSSSSTTLQRRGGRRPRSGSSDESIQIDELFSSDDDDDYGGVSMDKLDQDPYLRSKTAITLHSSTRSSFTIKEMMAAKSYDQNDCAKEGAKSTLADKQWAENWSFSKIAHENISDQAEDAASASWIDVGAEIGLKLLGSAHVQRAITSHDTAERIQNAVQQHKQKQGQVTKQKAELVRVPVHPMWTSAAAGATIASEMETGETNEDDLASVRRSDLSDTSKDADVLSVQSVWVDKVARYVPATGQSSESGSIDETTARRISALTTLSGSSVERHSTMESIEVVRGLDATPAARISPPSYKPLPLLPPGIKVVVPIFPHQPQDRPFRQRAHGSQYQMGTVISSKRICVPCVGEDDKDCYRRRPVANCLSVTVALDKSFLRNGAFAQLTYRVMDAWGITYVPRHSKLPIGSCVATTYGLGVLVSWRVEDDCHVVRSLWRRRGSGSASAYLRRESLHGTVEAAVGFDVETTMQRDGSRKGTVMGYVNGGNDFRTGKYLVAMRKSSKHLRRIHTRNIKGDPQILLLNRADVLMCKSARFIPVIELIREAAQYRLSVDSYEAALQVDENKENGTVTFGMRNNSDVWGRVSKYGLILWESFLKAIEEDDGFDQNISHIMSSVIRFLERLDHSQEDQGSVLMKHDEDEIVISASTSKEATGQEKQTSPTSRLLQEKKAGQHQQDPFWVVNDVFGGIFRTLSTDSDQTDASESIEAELISKKNESDAIDSKGYDLAYAVLETLVKTVDISTARCADEPDFKIGLSLCHEILVFIKMVIKIQQRNVSPQSLAVWRRAWEEILSTFGPIQQRVRKIGEGIAQRMEQQGRRAKVRLLRFVDIIVQDGSLLVAAEQGEWDRCLERVERAMVEAGITDDESLANYRKAATFAYKHMTAAAAAKKNRSAAARNNRKLAQLATAVQYVASPRRTILKFFSRDEVLGLLERMLSRVFWKEEIASRMILIHASNFNSLRQFRMLRDFALAGRLWMPLLDAADAECSWLVSGLPDHAKEFASPLSNLFSLCVSQFHRIDRGDLTTTEWLDFLLQDEAVSIIHQIDMKVILALESFSRDLKDVMVALPYYSNIEDDLLNLVDEMDLDTFLKEAAAAIDDVDKLSVFIREKTAIAIERFLDYLPKMSIPVERRDLSDGWMLTCRGRNGGDLRLSDVGIRRENLTCQVLGGESIMFPPTEGTTPILDDTFSGHHYTDHNSTHSSDGQFSLSQSDESESIGSDTGLRPELVQTTSTFSPQSASIGMKPFSVLDDVRELLLQAKKYNCWNPGVGGVVGPSDDRYVSSALHGLPVSTVLQSAINLWRNLEIDDDELMEIAIRDVSYQIKLQKEREESTEAGITVPTLDEVPSDAAPPAQKLSIDCDLANSQNRSREEVDSLRDASSMWANAPTPISSLTPSFDAPFNTPNQGDYRRRARQHHHNRRRSSAYRFNPRVDPTVIYLEIKKLTLQLDSFHFRIEKHESKRTIFDPVFEGCGTVSVHDVSIKFRVECVKRVPRDTHSQIGLSASAVPVLVLKAFDVQLAQMKLKLRETGADWLLNKVVGGFSDRITQIMCANMKDQMRDQIETVLQNVNGYFELNPELMLNLLGITLEDLELIDDNDETVNDQLKPSNSTNSKSSKAKPSSRNAVEAASPKRVLWV